MMTRIMATESTARHGMHQRPHDVFPCPAVTMRNQTGLRPEALALAIFRMTTDEPGYLTSRTAPASEEIEMAREKPVFSERGTEAACTRRCSIPIPAVSRAPGLAMYRDVQVPQKAGEGETAKRSSGWPGPCRERHVRSNDSYGCIDSRGGSGVAEPLRVPPYVPAVPSSGKSRRVEPRSGFHRSVPRAKRYPTLECEAISRSPAVASPAVPGPLLCASSGSFAPHRRSGGCEFRRLSGCW